MDWYKKNNDYLDYAFIFKDAYSKEWKNAAIGFVSEWDEFSENQKKEIEKQIPGISAAIKQLKIR